MRVVFTFLLAFMCFNAVSSTQQSQFLTRISTEEGLSQSSVTKIVKDQRGYLWIGTHMGLNRFDGYNIVQIGGPEDVLFQDTISTLFVDTQGYIWVGTGYSGLFRVDPIDYEFELIVSNKLNGLSNNVSEVLAIVQQTETVFWFAASGRLLQYDSSSKEITEMFKLPTSDDIFRALLLRDKNTLLAASSEGLYQVNLETYTVTLVKHKPDNATAENSNNVKFLKKLDGEGILVGTVEGLFFLPENRENAPSMLLENLNIWDVEYKNGQYYLGTDQGLLAFDLSSKTTRSILKYSNSRYPTSDNNVVDIFVGESNELWLASRSQGLFNWQFTAEKFNHITTAKPYNLSNENVWSIFQDTPNILWVGTDNGLNKVNLLDKSHQVFFTSQELRNADNSSYIAGIYQDSEASNLLWILNGNGLNRFNKSTGELSSPIHTPGSKALMEDSWPGGLWVEDNENMFFFNEMGYFRYNGTNGEVEELTGLKDLDFDLSYTFLGFLPNSNKLLLTTSGHLYSYDLRTEQRELIYRVDKYQPQTFNYVSSWLIDDKNTLWLSISGYGLVGLDKNTYKEKHRFDINNGLHTNYIHSLLSDHKNGIWLSSQAGLHRLNLDNYHIEHYGSQDGLLSPEFNGFADFKLMNGDLAFGSPLGVTYFSPKQFVNDTNLGSYKVFLTEVDVMSGHSIKLQEYGTRSTLELPYDAYGLKFSFSTLNYSHIDKTSYVVSLKGERVNLNWDSYTKNELLLPKLASGRYQLSIQARHPISGEVSQVKTVSIIVQHAPWSSPLAKAIYLLLFISSLAWYVWFRNKQNRLLSKANQQIQYSKARMEMALVSSKSGIWEYNNQTDHLYQETLYKELGYSVEEINDKGRFFLSLVHPDALRNLKPKWAKFLNGELKDWQEVYQLRSKSGQWLWFKFIGKAIKFRNDKPVRFSGTYKNITEEKAIEEKAITFGSAFSQINDWVLILDEHYHPLTANNAFYEALGTSHDSNKNALKHFIKKLGLQNYKKFKRVLKSLSIRENWQGEEYIATNSSESHPVLIKINAIEDEPKKARYYVIVISDITAQKEAEEKLRQIAHYDFLTNLPNRKLLHEKLNDKVKNRNDKFALFFIDLDKFKAINDIHTHSVGDKLLKYVAEALLELTPRNSLVARQSGDEFLVIINDYSSIDDLSHLAQEILDRLKQTIAIDSLNINVSSSIGITLFPEDSTCANELVQKADVAMLHAKNNGRNQFQFYTLDMNVRAHYRLQLENELKIASEQNLLTNYYQPIVNTKDNNKVIGCELLLRWFHRNELISPAVFIPIAEETGLIKTMTINAINQALVDYKKYFFNIEGFYISINLSPVHLIQKGLADTLLNLLNKYQLPPSILRFEITETSVLDDLDVALEQLNDLRNKGFVLLLDDFGTGYSSMTYLSRFPVNYIKIDKSFILNIHKEANLAIVQSILYLADRMGLTCIAEGVETKEHLLTLHKMECCKVQGFYFSKPLPVDEFFAYLSNEL